MLATCHTFLLTDDDRVGSRLAAEFDGSSITLTVFKHVDDLKRAERPAEAVAMIIDARHSCWRVALQQASCERTSTVVMVLTRTNNSAEKIEALELGADQALCRWDDFSEVKARLAAMVRRLPIFGTVPSPALGEALGFGGWEFRPATRQLRSPTGLEVVVSDGVGRLLMVFLTSGARYMTTEDIKTLMAARYPGQDKATTDWRVRIHRLRGAFTQLEPGCEPVRNVRGQGYVFGERLKGLS